jgi:N-acetylglucosamine-6-sulfatase
MKRKISRSTFLLGVSGAAALATFRLPASEAATTGRRNVLWVVSDDQPQYMMGPMPVTRAEIRDVGTEFSSGSTDIPLCGPARASLLTGLSVTTHHCDTNLTWQKFLNSPLQLQVRTVARYLKDAGYAMGHFGKYVNGHWGSGVPPLGSLVRNMELDRQPGQRGRHPDRVSHRRFARWRTSLVWAARRCADFVRNHAARPWFAQYWPLTTAPTLNPDPALGAPLRRG